MEQKRTVLITGATGGIGKATAVALANLKYRVIIHGRNEEKTLAVCDEIRKISGNNDVDYIIGDLFLMSDVKKMAEIFISKYNQLDILINNAGGIMSRERSVTAEGVETTIAVNLLAPFFLTSLLLDLLKKSNDARIINISSNSHRLNAKPDFNDIELTHHFSPLAAYGNAKLFLIWISQHLSVQLKEDGHHHISVYTVHPGAVATSFGVNSNLGGILNLFGKLARPFFKTPEQGAETIIYLATSDEVQTLSGEYFEDKKPAKVSGKYYSKQNVRLIWDYCKRKVSIRTE